MTQNFARVLLLGCCSGGAAVGAVPGERQWVLFQGCGGGAVLGGPATPGVMQFQVFRGSWPQAPFHGVVVRSALGRFLLLLADVHFLKRGAILPAL